MGTWRVRTFNPDRPTSVLHHAGDDEERARKAFGYVCLQLAAGCKVTLSEDERVVRRYERPNDETGR